jgi:hypothetical protein
MMPEPTESPRGPRPAWPVALAVALITGAVFSGSWQAEFVKWDDDINITRNTRVHHLGREQLAWMFTDVASVRRYMPLGWLGFAIHNAWFGITPRSYHVGNVLLYSVGAMLLFWIIRGILRQAAGHVPGDGQGGISICAALGALFWAIHPLRVEVVAWASGRLYCQAVLFLFVSLWAYLHSQSAVAAPARCRLFYWTSVLAFAASLLTYPIALAFPAALLALDGYPLRRFKEGWWGPTARRAWLEKVPFVIVTVGLLGATLFARAHGVGVWAKPLSLAEFSLVHRIMQAFYIWAWYLWKALLPLDLSPVYTRLVSFQPGDGPFLGAMAGIVGVTGWLVWRRRRWPSALLLWLTYLALLVPALGLTEHPHYASDRYSLLAHVVGAVGVAAGLLKLGERCGRSRGWLVAAGALVAVCAALSVRQTLVWRNSEILFRHMVRTLGNDPYRAEILWRLGEVLALQGRLAEAAAAYEEGIRIAPKAPNAHNGLGELLAQQGKWREALVYYSRALDLSPGLLRALNNIAWTLATADDNTVRNGVQALGLAQALNERSGIRNAQFLETLAAAYAETGQFDRAIATAEQIPAMAKMTGEYEVAARNEKLIQLYRAGQPYRQRGKLE